MHGQQVAVRCDVGEKPHSGASTEQGLGSWMHSRTRTFPFVTPENTLESLLVQHRYDMVQTCENGHHYQCQYIYDK